MQSPQNFARSFGVRSALPLLDFSIYQLVREANDFARLFNFSKQFPNSFLLAWQHQVRPDIGQGSKDKLS